MKGLHAITQKVRIGAVDRFKVTPVGTDDWRIAFYAGKRCVSCELTALQARFLRAALREEERL